MTSIDPRFDPRFQRGYAGEGDEPTPPPAAGASAGAPVAARIPEPPSSVPPTAESPSSGRESVAGHGLSADWPTLGEETGGDGDETDGGGDDGLEPHRRNPWLIALWAVSIAMIVVPTAVFRQALSEQRNAPWSDLGPPPEVIYMQLALQLVPALVLMGGIGVLLAIGVHAWGWNTRHRRAAA